MKDMHYNKYEGSGFKLYMIVIRIVLSSVYEYR